MKPLLDIRWVCAICLKVFHAPLKVTKRWVGGHGRNYWGIIGAYEPICCNRPVLLAGEPKVDRWGSGAMIDPVDNLRLRARAA